MPAKVKSLVIFHHEPSHDDVFLDGIQEFCQQAVTDQHHPFTCFLAQEGRSIEV